MEGFMRCSLSALALLAMASLASCQFGPMHENNTGWFYFYASGQIVVANPNINRVFYTLRTSAGSSTPFPNRCPGSKYRGQWADVTYGPGKRTLMATAAYETPAAKRSPSFSDGILTAEVTSANVDAFTPLDKAPATALFVPTVNKVVLTSSGTGATTQTLKLLSTKVEEEDALSLPAAGALGNYGKEGMTVAPGQFLHHANLGGQAYLTSSVAPGIFSVDLYHRNMHPWTAQEDFKSSFISFSSVGCPATGEAVYSRMLRQAFIACTELPPSALSNKLAAGKARRGVIQFDTLTNRVVKVLPYTADKLFVTPDESFLLILNSAAKTVYMLQLNTTSRDVVKWNDLPIQTGYTPVDIAFAAKPPYYYAYISYLDADRIGILDFQRVLQCGQLCAPDNSASFIQDQQQMGFQNVPPPDSGFQGKPEPNFVVQTTRAIAAGGGFVCQSSVYEMAVYCFSPAVGAPIKFQNISFAQHIRYVPGPLTNYTDELKRINPLYDCSQADEVAAPPSAGGDVSTDPGFLENSAPSRFISCARMVLSASVALAVWAFLFRP